MAANDVRPPRVPPSPNSMAARASGGMHMITPAAMGPDQALERICALLRASIENLDELHAPKDLTQGRLLGCTVTLLDLAEDIAVAALGAA